MSKVTRHKSGGITALIDDGPCKGCPLAERCKEHELACARFWLDVDRAAAPKALKWKQRRYPTKEVYDFIFSGLDQIDTGRKDKRGKPIFADPPGLASLRNAAMASLPKLNRMVI